MVETPYGEQKVVDLDHRRDALLTEDPGTGLIVSWRMEEVEEIAPPDLESVEALERWLRIKAVIVPSLEVEVDTVRCLDGQTCNCSFCYRIVKTTMSARGTVPRQEVTHHCDNETCQCDSLRDVGQILNPFASDCRCMEPVNLRWKA